MQAPLTDLLLTASLSAALVAAALVALAALPWSAADLAATEGAFRRAGGWVRARAILAIGGRVESPPPRRPRFAHHRSQLRLVRAAA